MSKENEHIDNNDLIEQLKNKNLIMRRILKKLIKDRENIKNETLNKQ